MLNLKLIVMAKRIIQEINAGSMADIAFLLLIFFLVTTTMDTDLGILRKLPPDIQIKNPPKVIDRNVLTVLVNRENNLLVENESLDIKYLKETAKSFIVNINNNNNLPVLKDVEFPYFGKLKLTPNHVISLQSDKGTSYGAYIAVQNELAAAYQELKDELARDKWGISYIELTEDYRKVIDKVYPIKISEAEPVSIATLE